MTATTIDTTRVEVMVDNDDNNDDHVLDEFASEIARMSQDTDAILDSICRAAQPTPTVARKRRTLQAILQKHNETKSSLAKHHHDTETEGDDEGDDDDDDMTDDGSVPEEVKRKIQDELTLLDTKFSYDPDGVSEEIRRVSMESLSPLAAMQADEESVKDCNENVVVSQLVGMQIQLALQAVVVWLLVIGILVRVWHKGLLDDNGLFSWPFVFSAASRTTV